VVIAACGCAAHFPLPMTAEELLQYDSGAALVAYLGQPDASPAVCDLRARGPHVPGLNADARQALVGGLVDGKVPSPLWRQCVDVFLKGAPPEDAASLFDEVARAYRKLLTDSDLPESTPLQERLGVLHRLYLERPAGTDPHPEIIQPILEGLRVAVAKAKLSPVALHFAQEILETMDLERGTWSGHPVDLPTMDALAAGGNEMTLRRFFERLPTAELRQQAERRLIRIHIALSPFPEVKAQAAVVEESMIKDGSNHLALSNHSVSRAWLDAAHAPMRWVIVSQSVWEKTAKLLGYRDDQRVSILPELSLRGALLAQVEGISQPVTLCARDEDLDPSPCLAPKDVVLTNPLAYLDKGGAFHFSNHIAMSDAAALAQGERFTLAASIGGQQTVAFDWGLSFARPEDLVFTGARAGQDAPALSVVADQRAAGRYVFDVTAQGGGRYLAVVEPADVGNYQLASVGANGWAGSDGMNGFDGASGSSGMSATCPSMSGTNGSNGGSGGNGGDGSAGGTGGNGGDVRVSVICSPSTCGERMRVLQTIVSSRGGAGGPGGRGGHGGRGGQGGSGGSGTSCTDTNGNVTYLSGGSSGMNGSDGSPGSDGWPGAPGRPGFVQIQPAR
jgi:hypothetical protein